MQGARDLVKKCAQMNDDQKISELLSAGFDPNFENGWPIRVAARYGSYAVVKTLIQFGANPHLLGETGATALQLAVFSNYHWETEKWSFLLSCYDSSQLADGAAVAVVFRNIPALKRILQTGRCNTRVSTTLTGKTVEQLAKGYKLQDVLLENAISHHPRIEENTNNLSSPRVYERTNNIMNIQLGSPLASTSSSRQLSPSVARFFNQTANQSGLTPPRTLVHGSPCSH